MTDTKTDRTLEVRASAADTIARMHRQAAAIQEAWKSTHPEYGTDAHASLSKALSNILVGGWGDTTVHRDDDLSLLLVTGITIGVIFFGKHREVKEAVAPDIDMSYGAARTGRYCMSAEGDSKYCGKPYTWRGDIGNGLGVPTCEGHSPFPVTMPIPGEWSLHS